MKKCIALVLVFALIFCLFGCAKKVQLIKDEPVKSVQIIDFPSMEEYTFVDDDAKIIVNYILSLDLITDFDEDPTDYEGGSYTINIEYENGETVTVFQYCNMFIKTGKYTGDNHPWYKLRFEDCERLDNILKN